ncbi:hypothetical protein ACFL2U_00130 [Patescibacteria group bacterium]
MKGQKGGELTPLQEVYSKLINRQQQALRISCPNCQEELERQDIMMLVCSHCKELFLVDTLLLNLALKKCCQNCYGDLEIKNKDTVFCLACDLEFEVDKLIKDP